LRLVLRLTVKQAEFAALLDLYQSSKMNNMTSKNPLVALVCMGIDQRI